ncbi:MAG: prepilin-type N-terminal cleavage/methylation domain-containing protein, partial [Gammaproteobacteria bacterium]|nr:prepilin-type N-terminal cleavage/methylation domain-containing protein [Gammaproteobacteria bacterium]
MRIRQQLSGFTLIEVMVVVV